MKSSNGKKVNPNMKWILMGGAAILVILAGVLLFLIFNKYNTKNDLLDDVNDLYNPSSAEEIIDKDTGEVIDEIINEEFDSETGISNDFMELYKINKDVVGHLSIPGTALSLPIVKPSDPKDKDFYLNHTIKREENSFGTPYIDIRATFTKDRISDNLTIYGHAAQDGTFFDTVKKYSSVDYYKKHPIMSFNTIYGRADYKIIGMVLENTDINDPKNRDTFFNYHDYIDMDEGYFNNFLTEMYSKSYFTTGVDVEYGDQLITLSTCNTDVINSLSTPYRNALIARKIRPGESKSVDLSVAENNINMVMPEGWVKKFGKKNPFVK